MMRMPSVAATFVLTFVGPVFAADESAVVLDNLREQQASVTVTDDGVAVKATSPLTPELLGKLASVENLRELSLTGHWLTDAHLAALRLPKSLRLLSLVSDVMTDDGLAFLARETELEELRIGGQRTIITDDALKHVAGLTQLRSFSVNCARDITDAGMIHLGELVELRALRLATTRVSDERIDDILRFRKLEMLDVRGTEISDEGIERLQAELPNCRILH